MVTRSNGLPRVGLLVGTAILVVAGCLSTAVPGPTTMRAPAVSPCDVQGVAVGSAMSSTERVSGVVLYDTREDSEVQVHVVDDPYSSRFAWVTSLGSIDQAEVVTALARQGVAITTTPTGGAAATDEAIRDRRRTGRRIVGFTHVTELRRSLTVNCLAGLDVVGTVTVFASPETTSFFCDETEGLATRELEFAQEYC